VNEIEMSSAKRPAVGCKVRVKASGRVGKVLLDDGSDLPFKAEFSDGSQPEVDWFRADALELVPREQAEVTEAELLCPICFGASTETAATPCGHVFCQPCIEHVMNSNKSDPTKACCPMCRADMCLFDLRAGDGSLLHSRNQEWSELAGCIFVQAREFGLASFHFEDSTSAHVSYEHPRCQNLRLDDGSPLPSRKAFEDAFWHAPTRTFHGTLKWAPSSLKGSANWRFVMQFASEFGYICGGSVAMTCLESDCKMDGTWRVVWLNGSSAEIVVEGGGWELMGVGYRLNLRDPECMTFIWPGLGVTQQTTATPSQVEEAGSEVTWTTDHPDYPTIKWVRVSRKSEGPAPCTTIGFGPGGWSYVRFSERSARPPRFHAGSIWGNCFMQSNTVGLASYHFGDSEAEGAYISYENEGCASWPSLDNGAPIPARVPFTSIEWDSEARCFRGVIDWLQACDTTLQGIERWHYEMVFDQSFMFIASGHCRQIMSGGTPSPKIHRFGDDLLYVNAAAAQQLASRRGAGETWPDVREAYAGDGAGHRVLEMLHFFWRWSATDTP